MVRRTGGLADTVRDIDNWKGAQVSGRWRTCDAWVQCRLTCVQLVCSGSGVGARLESADAVLCLSRRFQEERNGFTFDGTDPGSMYGALDRAIALYKGQYEQWNEIAVRNMRVSGW